MIKIDLITGFLGSGKTTFIHRYAKYLIGKREKIAVLENDYGAVNVDALLLSDLEGENCEIETVAGGCDHDCHVRRFRTKLIALGMQGFDRVIIEPSGIYDVDEFFDVLHDEPLDRWYEIGNVIAILDAKPERDISEETRYFLLSELATAGMLVLSHLSQKPNADHILNYVNDIMKEFGCDRRFTRKEILAKEWDALTGEDYARVETCGYRQADHIRLPLIDDNAFASLYFLNVPLSLDEMKRKAPAMISDPSFGRIIRIKGFHNENGRWFELNVSRNGMEIKQCDNGQEVFIVIGEKLKRDVISSFLGIGDDVWHNGQVYAGSRAE